MTEIYLDDYQLHSLTTDGLPTRVNRGLEGLAAPEIRLDAYNNPGFDGQTVSNALTGGRVVVLEGKIRGATESEYRTNRREFAYMVQPLRDSSGRLIPRVLKLTDSRGDEYWLNVVVQSLKNPDMYPTHSDWQLQLLATGPIESAAEKSLTISLPISGGTELPTSLPMTFGASSGGSGSASAGTIPAYPTIRFYGPMENPRIINSTTGQEMALSITLVSGDVVTIDMSRRTIIQGDATNRMGTMLSGSRFWALQAGENQLSFSATTYDAGYVTVTWRDAMSGI